MATKLKILHVMTPWYPVPTKDYGGVEKFISDLLNQQAKNHSITLFATGDSSISSGISLKYIFNTHIADQGWDRSAELIQALAVVDELKRNTYDIVHVHNLHPLLSLLHLIPRVKIIFTHHSVLTKERKLIHELTREQNSKVQFIFLSNAHRNEYRHVDNAKVVPLGIDLKDFPIPEEVARKDYFASLRSANSSARIFPSYPMMCEKTVPSIYLRSAVLRRIIPGNFCRSAKK